MHSIKHRIERAERFIGINEANGPGVLTSAELEELRTALRMALESGVPPMLPPDHAASEGEQRP
jgi:hypothetical protein